MTSTNHSGGGARDDEGTPMQSQRGQHNRSDDTSESMKGFTDGVIMQTRDYAIEYEDPEMVPLDRDGSTSSGTEKGHQSALRTRGMMSKRKLKHRAKPATLSYRNSEAVLTSLVSTRHFCTIVLAIFGCIPVRSRYILLP